MLLSIQQPIKKSPPCRTTYKENIINDKDATDAYNYLVNNIQWEEGIRSRKGFTRLAKSLDVGNDLTVDWLITMCMSVLCKRDYFIEGIYLNYYRDGNMWTPTHKHLGTHQLVISLGVERPLVVNKKNYNMTNGSAIIFGSAPHGVPKSDTREGRISIAVFLQAK